ncbi:contractile injection system protein, VgrG/Pvc8 family [Vibrio cholerae]|nr:phage tail protein [Vibrio cholerae]
MGLEYRPDFSIVANGNDITKRIAQGLIMLTLTDNSDNSESDRLAISFTLPYDTPTPKKGAVLRVGLGFNGELVSKGQFVVDEVSSSGPPKVVQIVANAAPMNNRKQPGSLQTQKTRSWHQVSLGDIVKTVASEHGLTPRVSSGLESTPINHVDQTNESDMALLNRLARRYGAVSKPANGYWLLLKEGEGKTVSGKKLDEVTIYPHDVSLFQFRFNSRENAGTTIATYHDVASGDTKQIQQGNGDPVFRIAYKFPNYQEAEHAVRNRHKMVKSGSAVMDITMPARPDLMSVVAEGYVNVSGFGDQEDGKWRVKTVEWRLSDAGLQFRIAGDRGSSDS